MGRRREREDKPKRHHAEIAANLTRFALDVDLRPVPGYPGLVVYLRSE